MHCKHQKEGNGAITEDEIDRLIGFGLITREEIEKAKERKKKSEEESEIVDVKRENLTEIVEQKKALDKKIEKARQLEEEYRRGQKNNQKNK